jgi:ankyrin repeat protein
MRGFLFFVPVLLFAQQAPDKGHPLLEAIHQNDLRSIKAALIGGADANTADELGSTALMHAAAYASTDCMRMLIAAGADVNAASRAGFTALMWAASDPAKIRLLVSQHADVKARSKDGNTALILARQNGFAESIPVLLDAGAPDEDGMPPGASAALRVDRDTLLEMRSLGIEPMHLGMRSTPMFLVTNLAHGSAEPVTGLLDAGADPNKPLELLTLRISPVAYAGFYKNLAQMSALIDRGANVNAKGARGLTPLMVAAMAEFQSPEVVRLLLAKGAEIDARDDMGRTALDWASLQGETDVVRTLRDAGGHALAGPPPTPAASEQPRSPRDAVEKAIALLQPIGPNFFKQSGGCISCHNNTLPGMAMRRAMEHKFPVDAATAAHHEKAALSTYRPMQENLAVGASSIAGLVGNISYELAALAEERYPRNFVTDAAALALLRLQRSDGSWTIADVRPPLSGSDIHITALVVRAVQAYIPSGMKVARDAAIAKARNFLLEAPTRTTQDEAFAVLGLRWAGAPEAAIAKRRNRLLAMQRESGGWAHLPTLGPDAYATGQALYALEAGAGVKPSHAAYRRGVDYLLRTQLPDGSWFVQSRGLAFQPYQETGFPHGRSQFLSAAATSWAVMAIAPAVDVPNQVAQSAGRR